MQLPMPESIVAGNLVLRRLRYEDAEEIFFTYASKPEGTRYVSWPTHQRLKDTRDFLRYAVNSWNRGLDYSFSIRLADSNRLVGSIGAINDTGKIQFGYFIAPSQWGRGYATAATKALLAVLKSMPGIKSIKTFVDAENAASIRVLQKCGLVEEARIPAYYRFVNQNNQAKECILFKLELPAPVSGD
ncbi:MAG: GNAT family N-acetyltransferase [Flammeovirgaceae bacterium]|nr:MAG: GNAT family N-acetyltransferase [Flammeovirgaceae bacterium]